MVLTMFGEPTSQESKDTITCRHKCRIPLRLSPGRRPQRPGANEQLKSNGDVMLLGVLNQGNTSITKPVSGELCPKTANRESEMNELNEITQIQSVSRSSRAQREKLLPAQKNPASSVHKKTANKQHSVPRKADRHIITVPVRRKFSNKTAKHNNLRNIPDQEIINKSEDLELKQLFRGPKQLSSDINDFLLDIDGTDSVASKNDEIMHFKNIWQEKMVQFEEMKNELNDRQRDIMEIYAELRSTKKKLTALGENAKLPSANDLHIMNVANMSLNQSFNLCAETKYNDKLNKNALAIDLKKLNEMPSKLIATCEQALSTRKDFIEWFENLKNQEKGCSKSVLSKKINEFNTENDMLSNCLKSIEKEFLEEINEFIRIFCNQTITLQLRNEELICEVSEVNSDNADLRKKIGNLENQKTFANKLKIEALEQELKEEKMKKMSIRDRLSRAEGQVRIGNERSNVLESALNQARAQTRTLERTIQQLNDKNNALRKDYDEELTKVKESMQKNTAQLEEIALAKEELQIEKEDLKNKLQELSKHYTESIINMKEELNKNTAQLIDVEKKYNDEIENKKHLQTTVESQYAHLAEYELRYKGILKDLQEKESVLSELIDYKNKYEKMKQEFDDNINELKAFKDREFKQIETLRELEQNLNSLVKSNEKLNVDIKYKEECIVDLKNEKVLCNQQIEENEKKMETYEEQLIALKNHIIKLKEYFGDFENLNHLHELVRQKKDELNDINVQIQNIRKEIEDKENTLNSLTKTILELEDHYRQMQGELKTQSDEQETQHDKLLLMKILSDKDNEMKALISNVETMKEQIDQLEKIILTLENQNRRAATQKQKDLDNICALNKRILELEYYIQNKSKNLPLKDLDYLIKSLEDELETNLDLNSIISVNDNKNKQNEQIIFKDFEQKHASQRSHNKRIPTNIVMRNFVKKTYFTNKEDKRNVENQGGERAIIDTKMHNEITKNTFSNETFLKTNDFPSFSEVNPNKPKVKLRNMRYIETNNARDEKKK